MRYVVPFTLLLISPSLGQAQEPSLTLDDAIGLARKASPARQAAEAGVQAAEAARSVAGLRPNPIAGVEVENVGGNRAYDVAETPTQTASIALPIELGGKRSARIKVAAARGAQATIDSLNVTADLRLAVTQAYTDVLATERRLAIAREEAGIAAEGLHAAQVRVQAGRASPLEESRATVVKGQADLAVERTGRLAVAARQALALRIGYRAAGPLDEPWFDRIMGGVAISAPGALVTAAARASVEAAAAQERLAATQRMPDVTISAGVRRVPMVGSMAAVFGLSVPLPLFNNGAAALAQARAERTRAEALARAAALDATEAATMAAAERDNAAGAARAAIGPMLAAAREAARIARIGYREGKFGQLDLIEAERTLAATRMAAIDALADYHDKQARLDRLTTSYDGAVM